jgi:hypothetical protein
MAEVVYLLCAITSLVCAALLFRSYRRSPVRLILWTSLCFAALAVNNILLFIDLAVFQGLDLSLWRNLSALAGVSLLLYGMITSDP